MRPVCVHTQAYAAYVRAQVLEVDTVVVATDGVAGHTTWQLLADVGGASPTRALLPLRTRGHRLPSIGSCVSIGIPRILRSGIGRHDRLFLDQA